MQTQVAGRNRSRQQALSLLRQNSGTLGHWTTWRGNYYWSNAAGDLMVAYRVVRGVALALTEPISARAVRPEDIAEFAAFCAKHRWIPAFYAVQDASLCVFSDLGWHALAVGQEALLDTAEFDLSESAWHKVRHAHNRAERQLVDAQWVTWRDLSLFQHAQIRNLSSHWESRKRLPRLGFTLGGVRELTDPEVRLMLGVTADGEIQAVTSWLPIYRDGKVVGRTLDLMRRAPHSFNGINEFLIGSVAGLLQSQGQTVMSLSGVPFGGAAEGGQEIGSLLPRMVYRLLASRLEALYGFENLFNYKLKFNPSLRTIHLVFPNQAQFPRIALAVARAYLPSLGLVQTIRMLLRGQKPAA
jgi:phosphatidylglycerol lysyltransferase